MRDFELEEGEAYFIQDDDDEDIDDDENIDPDRDFSYIDRKIENVLGHYQKDFMGGLSAESLGARYGGYGSFLPMQQRSPSILSNQRTQSHGSSKSPHNPMSERFHQNPTNVVSNSLPVKPLPASNDHSTQVPSETGISSLHNQFKLQSTAQCASDHQQKKPMTHDSDQNSLKFRVKVASNSVLSRDKAEIYSGLGLDMSPSSLENSPSENDEILPGNQEMIEESPSFIIQIMTSFPVPNDALLSPLPDILASLMEMEKNLKTGLPGGGQALPIDIVHENIFAERNRETSKEKKSKLKEASKDRKLKHKAPSKEKKSKQKIQSGKPVELVSENHEYPTNAVDLCAVKGEESGTAVSKEVVSKTPSDATGSRPAVAFDKKSEVGTMVEDMDNSMKQRQVARDKPKEEGDDDGNVNRLGGKTEKDKNVILSARKESGIDKRNEVGRKEEEANKFLKQQNEPCDKVMEANRKQNRMGERILDDKEASFISLNVVEENVEALEPSKQKSQSKAVPSVKEYSSSVVKKKSQESQTPGISSIDPPRGENEVVLRSNIPSKSKRGDINLDKEMRKVNDVVSNTNAGKKGKEVSSKDFVMGVSERDTHTFTGKPKEKSGNKGIGFASNIGSNRGDLGGINFDMEKAPIGEAPPAENASVVIEEDWVQCEKCQKWRLLPFGTNPDFLPKKWICSMLNWLPGMNKCSFSEDETTNGLRALYLAPAPASQVQNNHQAFPDGSLNASGGAQHVALPSQGTNIEALPSGGKRKNLMKTELDEELHIPVKKDQQHSGEIRNSKNLKVNSRESDSVRKNGNSNPSKIEKKRVADFEVSGDPKKTKRMRPQSMENPHLVGPSTLEPRGENQNYGPSASRFSKDFMKESSKSPLMKAKHRTQNAMTAKNSEIKDISGKKRKLKDQRQIDTPTEEPCGKGQPLLNNRIDGNTSGIEHRREKSEKRSKPINFGNHSGGGKHNFGGSSENSLHKRARSDNGERTSQKTTDGRKSSQMALDLGLSDHGTTSSSSKISSKVRVKAREVKSSPIGSISSSPLKISKSKSRAEVVSDEFVPRTEEMKDRKSKMSRNPGQTADEVHSVEKISSGRCPSAHRIDTQPKVENHVTKSLNSLHFDETNSEKGKSRVSQIGGVREFEKGSGSDALRIDNRDDHVSLRHSDAIGHVSKDIGASSSMKDSFQRAAKSALREAKNLKHSADRLKISGSGLESTEVFFQAALKFLHGASLLEPGNNEGGRGGEMTSAEVYSTTAKLCEYCAHEYERCNDMASAALAYKCMEVAYMRVVYSNDIAASRDRLEMQMAVRAVSQVAVESPSSSASDIDNLNNQAATESVKNGHSAMDHRNHVISAGNRPNFVRLLNFTQDMNQAMDASRRSQMAFAAANPILAQAGNEERLSSIKRVLDFSFHDVDGLLHLVRLAMEALNS